MYIVYYSNTNQFGVPMISQLDVILSEAVRVSEAETVGGVSVVGRCGYGSEIGGLVPKNTNRKDASDTK